ncbi:Pimeloyl-ACP methyl ester carboxylesterase [Micromonospora avicenniae]|uniref:Pimeloyl-ACP methyl ester carboxylesterase n=2 Tax=Micromonospora avicenniae TaxID=1198245 RepID=A0A1N7DGC1_9ACTN|nr:Pimeloyl-ACP methyl ester carboxylesterase [Micromonospora avicenniae]
MSSSRQPPVGRFYDVDGRRLLLHRSGTGGPAVVFLPGASAFGLDYLNVHDRVAQFTTSVVYDRGGTGWSAPADLPRSLADVATELRQLLRTADVSGPYVLVAHSIGGAYARRYAQLFPEEVAGVVYLDAFHEDWETYLPRLRPQQVPGSLALRLIAFSSRGLYRRMFASWPDDVRRPLIERHLTVTAQRAGAQERSDQPRWRDELKAGGPVPDAPLVAMSALGVDFAMRLFMSPKALRAMNAGKQHLYEALAASVSNGEYRALETAKHSTIHVDCADAVTRAIADLWKRVS